MILISYNYSANNSCGVVLIFGVGLIGYSIMVSLQRHTSYSKIELPYSWVDLKKQEEDTKLIKEYLLKLRNRLSDRNPQYINIIWSAGKGGFNASELDLIGETASFESVVKFSEEIQSIFPDSYHFFHMLSSAGGLFEGECNVGRDSIPNPKRAYGIIKLKQEFYLLERNSSVFRFIYRPSSVYGFSGSGRRLGLVPTLILNAIQHKVSNIYGGMNTLRDYILASDIGDFVVKNVLYPPHENDIFILATGKPSTIFEIIHKIEIFIGHKFYVRYESSDINSADNSYLRQLLPEYFYPTDLDTGIRKTYADLIGSRYRSL